MIACPECGCIIDKGRSAQDHRRFFGLIRAAYNQWNESHAFKPSSEEQLRAWALVQAGWTNVATVEIPASYEAGEGRAIFRSAVEGACRAIDGPGGYHELRVNDAALQIVTARTIRWSEVGQREFGRIRDGVEAAIEGALNVTAEQLLRERAA